MKHRLRGAYIVASDKERRLEKTDVILRVGRGSPLPAEDGAHRVARPTNSPPALQNNRYAFGTGESPLLAGDRTVSQLDGVTLHLVVKGGALDAKKFGSFFLVAAALRECLENGVSLDVIETLYAAAR
jgi:hypothetical protein